MRTAAATSRARQGGAAAPDGAAAHRGVAGRHGGSARHRFTTVLMVLAVLVCVLWCRSRAKVDALVLFVGDDGRAQVLGSGDGRVCIALTNLRFGREHAWTAIGGETNIVPAIVDDLDVTRIQIYPPADPATVAAGFTPFGDGYLGFSFASSQTAVLPAISSSQLVYAIVPHWAIAVPLLLWSAWRMFGPAAERQRRLRKGQCVTCGYDLRASEVRCPECGTEMMTTKQPSHGMSSLHPKTRRSDRSALTRQL